MGTDPKLETYLTALDKALGPIPVSDRADILIEIKSHILDATERNPQSSIPQLLAALGEPEQVANRYLLERGLKPNRQSRAPIVKWLTIGFLGTFAIICFSFVALIWKFSPLVSVDEKNENVKLLGGLIDITGSIGDFNISKDGWTHKIESHEIRGDKKLGKDTKEILVPFSNAKIKIRPSTDGQVHWKCKMIGIHNQELATESKGTFTLNLANAGGAKCDIQVPALKSTIRGANGKITLHKPQIETEVTMSNGKVEITQDITKTYKFDLVVANGTVDKFESSTAANAIPIKVALSNGKIGLDDSEEASGE